MLETNENIKVNGQDTGIKIKTEWNPYNPTDLEVPAETLKLKVPCTLGALIDWYYNKLLGTGASVTPKKYYNLDIDILKMKLSDAIIDKDTFIFLHWVYQIAGVIDGENGIRSVFQMPEDYLRTFTRIDSKFDEYRKSVQKKRHFFLYSDIRISNIHKKVNEIIDDSSVDTANDAEFYRIINLKIIAVWFMILLAYKKNGGHIECRDGYTEIEVTYDELANMYECSQESLWSPQVNNTSNQFSGYLQGGRKYQLELYTLHISVFFNTIRNLANRMISEAIL